MIGIICLDKIVGLLTTRVVTDEPEKTGDIDLFSGQLNGADVALAVCTEGRMADAGEVLFNRCKIDCLIQIDLAVPLVPYLQQGDIVIVENVFQYPENLLLTDSDSQKIPVSMTEIAGDLLLAQRIKDTYDINFSGKSNRPEMIIGTVVTSSQILNNRRVIASLQRDFGAVAVDREGSAVGLVCRKHDCSFLGVRAVTEKLSGHSSSSLNMALETTMANLLTLIECVTTSPEMTSVV